MIVDIESLKFNQKINRINEFMKVVVYRIYKQISVELLCNHGKLYEIKIKKPISFAIIIRIKSRNKFNQQGEGSLQ
jgi:hypothetical protein